MVKKTKKPAQKPVIKRRSVRVEADPIKKTKIRVIGIGGGGGAIVSEIASHMPKASFAVINTDAQALRSAGKKVIRLQIGQDLTQGLGTGMNAELGREAAISEKEKIEKLLEGQDLCILVSCLGGGAGSGAAPVVARLSRSLGNITYGIFTLPFNFEGEKKTEIAKDALDQVKNYLNALTLIPNERVFQIIDKSTPLKEALSVINRNLSDSLEGLIDTIYQPGLINIDFADFRTILESKGKLAFLNTVEIQRKEGSTKEMVEQVLSSPLYPYSIRGAKGILFNIAGEKKLSLVEVGEISRAISALSHPEAKIIFGISQNPRRADTIRTTLLATGCGMKFFPTKPQKKVVKKVKKKVAQEPVVEEKPKPKPRPKKPKPKKVVVEEIKPEKKKVKAVVKKKVKIVPKPVPQANVDQSVQRVGVFAAEEQKDDKVRKNALQIRKESEEVEQEMLEKEKFWETPAFLRKKTKEV